jgi:inosose dehydratase
MTDGVTRRGFVTAMAAGMAGGLPGARAVLAASTAGGSLACTSGSPAARAAGGASAAAARASLAVGHTGITWGYAPQSAEAAIRDVASLGYHAFESFGSVLAWWEQRGGLRVVLEKYGLPLHSAYCPFELTDVSKRAENIANAKTWGRLIRACGGSIAVIGPNTVQRPGFDMARERDGIVSTLNEIGRALSDAGVTGALHPHTGSCVHTQDDVYAVMGAVDTRFVKLGPDMGELLAGGADPVNVVRDFLPIIRHAHLKDHDGGPTHDGYCPVGQGKVDMKAITALLETATEDLMLMVELNPSSDATAPSPLETARTSRDYLRTLGYSFGR